MRFPLTCELDDNGTLLVTCPLLPEVTTFADTRAEVQTRGREAVEEALGARISRWETIPAPDRDPPASSIDHADTVALSTLASIKAQLFVACVDSGVTRAELCRRLGWHREQVDRLFRFDHATRLDQFDAAFAVLDRRLRTEAVAA